MRSKRTSPKSFNLPSSGELRKNKRGFILGIDEVGRGPLAGPVVVCALMIPASFKINRQGLLDSKKLSVNSRAEWFEWVKNHSSLDYALASASPGTVDRLNVSAAANSAALRACNKLVRKYELGPQDFSVYLDGGLFLGSKLKQSKLKSSGWRAKTLIKADEKINAVSLASIMAKVSRDRSMIRAARKYPGYGLEAHKGYATQEHRSALAQLGPSDLHRLTFLKEWNNI